MTDHNVGLASLAAGYGLGTAGLAVMFGPVALLVASAVAVIAGGSLVHWDRF